MSAAEETLDGMPPTIRFRPTQRELVEFYLLPRARGQDPFPGVIVEDDAAGSSLPWDLFERHGLGSEDEAYFLVRATGAKKPGARQDRGCDGGVGSWKMQSSLEKGLRVGGEKVTCHKSNLNLHMGKGKNGGSVGWVMHEYTIAAPPCPSLVKICHIAFTGHGRKRKRVPDGQQDCRNGQASQVEATASGGSSGDFGAVVYPSADEERSPQPVLTQDIFPKSPLLDSSDVLGFPSAASANAEQYQELEQEVPSTEEQQAMMPQPMMVEQPESSMDELLCEEELELWNSIGVDLQSSNLWSSTGAESDSAVPHIGIMAEGHQDEEDGFLGFPSMASANAEQELDQDVPSTEERQAMMPQLMVQQSVSSLGEQLCAGELEFWGSIGVDVQSSNFWSSIVAESDSAVPHIGSMAEGHQDQEDDLLAFPSMASANAEQHQELEQDVPSTEERQAMTPQLMVQQSVNSLGEQLCAGEPEFWSSTGFDVQSSNFWSSTMAESDSAVPHIGSMAEGNQDQQEGSLDFPPMASANAEQYQQLEQDVPSTEERQAMTPQPMVQQSVSSLGEQLCAGELDLWSSTGFDVQNSNLGGNIWSPTEVDVQGNNDFAEQEFWSSTVVESDSVVVPHISDMEEGHQGQQEDFWSSLGSHVQSNCAMPDMPAGAVAAANCHWGGYCITC